MKIIKLIAGIVSIVLMTACGKGYNHQKEVYNNTRDVITVKVGCCDQEQTFEIQPQETVLVFECIYQQMKRPMKDEMSWDFSIEQANNYQNNITNPNHWIENVVDNNINYLFTVENQE